MLITRKIGGFLRGKSTPFQVVAACVLGALVGFVPGAAQAPGLLAALVLLLIVVNANLFVATVTAALAKLASLALLGLGWQFEAGYLLLEGPTQPIFRWAVNTPVLAWFGFENYTVTGGLLLGLVFGLVAGFLLAGGLTRFRRKMAALDEKSEKYKKLRSAWWSRLLVFVFVGGGHGKKTYEQLAASRIGLPVRPLGVVFALLVVGLLYLGQALFRSEITTWAVQAGLERANGATVDIESADLDPKTGRLRLVGLAMADPNDLTRDIFRAREVTADVSNRDLLTKRFAFDSVVASEAASGALRKRPGLVVGRDRVPAPPPETTPEEKTLEDYVAQAKEWKERLRQLREWLEKTDAGGAEPDRAPGAPRGETLRERLEREIRERGITNVTAGHLIAEAPRVLVRELRIEGLRAEQIRDAGGEPEVLDVRGENLSDAPRLVEGDAALRVTSRSGRIRAEVGLGSAGDPGRRLAFALTGLSGDDVGNALAVAGTRPVRGGTVDVSLDAALSGARIEAPLHVTLHGSTLAVPNVGETTVAALSLPIGIRGPIDNPAIRFENEALARALVDAGKTEAANRLRAEADKHVERGMRELEGRLGEDAAGRLREGLRGILGGGRDKDEEKE